MGRGRSARGDAETAFFETIDRVLKCITDDGLIVGGRGLRQSRPTLAFRVDRSRLALRGGGSLFLRVQFHYDFDEDPPRRWRLTIREYIFSVFRSNGDGEPWLDYHYHPTGRGSDTVTTPHLHVHVPIEVAGTTHAKFHLPTGRVAIEDVVAMLIRDAGVEPRPRHRNDWQKVLQEAREKFVELRRWA